MEKYIVKTSIQAKAEKENKGKENSCPECGGLCLGSVSLKNGGFLLTKSYKKNNYTCIKCSCEWSTGWIAL